MLTVVLLVALRLSLGCHFLYEGVWKIKNADQFSAQPFLTQAKGPAAELFYTMVPDLDGRERLRVETNKNTRPLIKGQTYLDAWDELQLQVVDRYKLSHKQKAEIEKTYQRYEKTLQDYLAENSEGIIAYFGSLDRFKAEKKADNNGAAFQKKRLWNRQQELRKELNVWLSAIEAMEEKYRADLWNLLDKDRRASGPLPTRWTYSDLLDFAVTCALTAIGLCLVLGLCTRLAAVGGGVFMIFVILTQPSWPTIYPPAPPAVGHALLINKDFVEMVALFMLATTRAGRWGGLDFFLYHWLGRPLQSFFNKKSKP